MHPKEADVLFGDELVIESLASSYRWRKILMISELKRAEDDFRRWFLLDKVFPPLCADKPLLLTRRIWSFHSMQSCLFYSSLAPQHAEMSLSRLRSCLTFTGGECQRCGRRHATPISSRAEAPGKLGFCWIFAFTGFSNGWRGLG